MEQFPRNFNPLYRRPSTERSKVEQINSDRQNKNPSHLVDPSHEASPIPRPQTNLKILEPQGNAHKAHLKILPKGTRIILGGKKPKPRPYAIPKVYSPFKDPEIEAFERDLRINSEFYHTHLPKLRPETHDLKLGVIKPTNYNSEAFSHRTETMNFYEPTKSQYDHAINPQIPYGIPQPPTIPPAVLRPNTDKKHKVIQQAPQTAQVKSRGTMERIMRMSTPQTHSEKRPDSRYNKETLCAGLNEGGRDKSPDYSVPVLAMNLHENIDLQYILPNCWK